MAFYPNSFDYDDGMKACQNLTNSDKQKYDNEIVTINTVLEAYLSREKCHLKRHKFVAALATLRTIKQ